jgi:hypothetical protein
MGTLFSCVFRAIELVTGTDTPPDPGGDTDPGGGCLDANNNGICDDEDLTTNVPSIIYQPNKEEGLVFLNS